MNLSFKSKLFQQLPLLEAARVAFAGVVCASFDPARGRTYAQTGEDLIILSLLPQWKSTFYVDVGCHHPLRSSNTYLLYQIGWHGLCIDANPNLIQQFSRTRPRDTAVCACVGGKEGTAQFLISETPLLSHVVGAASVHPDSDRGSTVEMSITPLTDLMRHHGVPRTFGLLSIDVEGMDEEILLSLDLNYWRPGIIVVEMHGLDLMSCASNALVQHLAAMRYKLVVFSASNAFFLDTSNDIEITAH